MKAALHDGMFDGKPLTRRVPQTTEDFELKYKSTKFDKPESLLDFYEKNRALYVKSEYFYETIANYSYLKNKRPTEANLEPQLRMIVNDYSKFVSKNTVEIEDFLKTLAYIVFICRSNNLDKFPAPLLSQYNEFMDEASLQKLNTFSLISLAGKINNSQILNLALEQRQYNMSIIEKIILSRKSDLNKIKKVDMLKRLV
jgi:hypothetical protein